MKHSRLAIFALAMLMATISDAQDVTPSQNNSDSADASAFASIAEREVLQLHEGITLAQWMETRGKTEKWDKSEDESFFDCRTLVRTQTLPSGARVAIATYFYPPHPPSPAILPNISGDELVVRTCTLAMVRLEAQAPRSQTAHSLTEAVTGTFVNRYGQSVGTKGTALEHRWGDTSRWTPGTVEIVAGYNPAPLTDDSGVLVEGPAVFVFARLPIVHEIEHTACCTLKAYHYRPVRKAEFRRALEITEMGPQVSAHFEELFDEVFRHSRVPWAAQKPEDLKWRESLVPVLEKWLTKVRSLPSLQRAAGLFAADCLMTTASEANGGEFSPRFRSALQHIGVRFTFDELGKSHGYSGNLLDEARKLNPDGVVGQMAMLYSLANGSLPDLGSNQDGFRIVIKDGDWLLAKKPDKNTEAQIHFIIGDAYSDIVAVAGGVEPDFDDSDKYKGQVDFARSHALEEYRAGLAIDNTSENARDAWLQAWHLLAGLLPSTRYVYIGD